MTEKVGISKVSAKKAIIETSISRVFLSFACLCTPAILFYGFDMLKMTPKTPKIKMGYETGVFIFSLMLALPASIALFPQTGVLNSMEIEETLRQSQNGEKISTIYYNKGLWAFEILNLIKTILDIKQPINESNYDIKYPYIKD